MKIAVLSSAHVHTQGYVDVLKNLSSVDEITLFDDASDRGRQFAKDNHIGWSGSLSNAISGSDAAIICSENSKHSYYAKKVAEAHIPVLCEKPLAANMSQGLEILESQSGKRDKFYMAQPVRSLPLSYKLKKLAEKGQFGDLISMTGTNHGSLPEGWFRDKDLAGGGAIMDHGVHIIDVMRYISNSEITDVYADATNGFNHLAIDDAVQITLQFSNGMIGSLDPSYSRGDYFPTWGDVKLSIYGTKNSIETDYLSEHFDIYHRTTGRSHRFGFYGSNMDYHLITDFIKTIDGKKTESPMANVMDGFRELETLMAIYESVDNHKRVSVKRKNISD